MLRAASPDQDAARSIRRAREAGLAAPIPRRPSGCGLVSLARGKGEFFDAEKAELVACCVMFHSHVRGLGAAISFAVEPTSISRRVSEVLSESAKGETDQEIADALRLSHDAVREYPVLSRAKLHAKNKVEAIALAASLGAIRF